MVLPTQLSGSRQTSSPPARFKHNRFETMSVLTLSWLNRKLFQMHFGHAREKVEDRNRFVGRGRTERAEGSNLIRR
eukprot:COSAG06_NODE_1169_length_10436_cov_1910.073619_7_plen_76_part_00